MNDTTRATVEAVCEAASALSREERLRVVDVLLQSLGPDDPDWEKAWRDECISRLEAYRRGEVDTFTLDEIRAGLAQQ